MHTIYGSGSLNVHKKKKERLKKSFLVFKVQKMNRLRCIDFKEMLRFLPSLWFIFSISFAKSRHFATLKRGGGDHATSLLDP